MTDFQMAFVPLVTQDGDLVNIPVKNWNVVSDLRSGYLHLSAAQPNTKYTLRYTIDLRKVFLLNIQKQTEVNAIGRTLGRTALTGIASSIFTKGGTNPLGGGLLDLSLRGVEKDTVVSGTLYFSPSSLEVYFSLSGDTFAQLLKWIPKDALSEERTELAIRDINLVKEMKRDGRIAIDELANSLVQKNNERSELLCAVEKGANIEIRHQLRQEASLKESELNRLKGFFISLLYMNGLSIRAFKATSACGPEIERLLLGSSEFLATKHDATIIRARNNALIFMVCWLVFIFIIVPIIVVLATGQNDVVEAPAKPVVAYLPKDAFKLGVSYYTGQGVTRDYAEALKWFRKAAEQGLADAQENVGIMYYNGRGVTQDNVEAMKWFRKAAEQGVANARNTLGGMYHLGQGVTKDDAEAMKWFRKAAEQGNALAQNNLGIMYYNGWGVTKDYAEAVKWYRKAAEQGYADAQNNLGEKYYFGQGVTKDDAEAVKWYRRAAEQGNAAAQDNLGVMYYNGQGVTKDDAEAVKWYRKAAEQGNAAAQDNLGVMYRHGRGVTKDDAEAVKWLRKAAEQGNADAQENLRVMGYSSTP